VTKCQVGDPKKSMTDWNGLLLSLLDAAAMIQ
jgi:hypothetical protein